MMDRMVKKETGRVGVEEGGDGGKVKPGSLRGVWSTG
jgi:hypothetical protein